MGEIKYQDLSYSDHSGDNSLDNIRMASYGSDRPSGQNELISGVIKSDSKGNFVDSKGRILTLKGINLDSSAKLPVTPFVPSYRGDPENKNDIFWDGENISFVGRPFPLEEAESHLRRIKSWGFNTIRYILTWEAIEHKGPGQYDEEFIQYTLEILRIIKEVGGLYVILDPHQDAWSRFSGGSGAPLWTLYAAGFDPIHFTITDAALLHNSYSDPEHEYPKMIWATNYSRLATETMFTMFFGGNMFFPKCRINGMNIQDFLQSHFLKAFEQLWSAIQREFGTGLKEFILGVETMNEPGSGLVGIPDLSIIPEGQILRVGTTPSPFQSFQLGMGKACTVDEYKISLMGPKKIGSKLVDPNGVKVWKQTDEFDKRYGFKRDWPLGTCIYELHGIWNSSEDVLYKPDYFSSDPRGNDIDEEYFINHNFVEFYSRSRDSIRNTMKDVFIFMQPPTLQIPPRLMGTELIDDKTVYCPHYYDGMSLMFKTWNKLYNVDTLGILRGRYSNPAFSVVFGEGNIRRCFRDQFIEIKRECYDNLGDIPVIMTETGMPFDMNDKKAYKDGKYDSQTSALDALSFALEGSAMNHTYWTYNHMNSHQWGDHWNNEDFSFWSKEDQAVDEFYPQKTRQSRPRSLTTTKDQSNEHTFDIASNRYRADSDSSSISLTADKPERNLASTDGVRAVNAIVRPYALAMNGKIEYCEFDLKKKSFRLSIQAKECTSDSPSLIYLPKWHFDIDSCDVTVTSGDYRLNKRLQVLEWVHEDGPQELYIESDSTDSILCCGGLCGIV